MRTRRFISATIPEIQYNATATLRDGRVLHFDGILEQCTAWAENIFQDLDRTAFVQITRQNGPNV